MVTGQPDRTLTEDSLSEHNQALPSVITARSFSRSNSSNSNSSSSSDDESDIGQDGGINLNLIRDINYKGGSDSDYSDSESDIEIIEGFGPEIYPPSEIVTDTLITPDDQLRTHLQSEIDKILRDQVDYNIQVLINQIDTEPGDDLPVFDELHRLVHDNNAHILAEKKLASDQSSYKLNSMVNYYRDTGNTGIIKDILVEMFNSRVNALHRSPPLDHAITQRVSEELQLIHTHLNRFFPGTVDNTDITSEAKSESESESESDPESSVP